jgi:hypothetical protein
MAVTVTERRKPLYQFATSLCAIIGGVFTMIGLFDSALHASLASFKAKTILGKSS